MGTVEGDIHSLGKGIVAAMLMAVGLEAETSTMQGLPVLSGSSSAFSLPSSPLSGSFTILWPW